MIKNDWVSTLEKRAVLAFALLALLFFLSLFVEAAIRDYRRDVSKTIPVEFAVDDPVPPVPAGLHLLTFPICLSLIKPRRFLVSTIFALLYAGLLLVSFYIRVNGESFLGGPIPGELGFFQELYLKTWIWDYVGLVFLIVLLPWLFSIIYRIHCCGALNAPLA